MAAEQSLERRVTLTLAAAVAIVMLIAMGVALLILRETIEQRIDARLQTAAAELQTGIARRPEGGGVSLAEPPGDAVFEERGSGWGWVIRDGTAIVARSRSLGGAGLPPGGLNEVQVVPGEDGEDMRALTAPLRNVDGLSVTVAAPQSVIATELARDAWILLVSIAALGLALMAVAGWQSHRALAPVASLADALREVRDGRRERLESGRISEINAVTGVINDLLAERRVAADESRDSAARLAHGLKTPLAVLAARFGPGGSTPDARATAAVENMERLITANLAAARASRPSAVGRHATLVAPIVDDLAFAFGHRFRDRGVAAVSSLSPKLAAGMPVDDLQETLGNILENAFQHAATEVAISHGGEGGNLVTLVIADDGPGFPPGMLDEPPAAPPAGTRNGLGIAIARDLLARHGGTLSLDTRPGGGARAILTLPAAATD